MHRHAAATRVTVDLGLDGGELRLVIVDNGKGYVASAANRDASLSLGVGIPGMEARIRQFNGTLEIAGEPGATTIRATVPLEVDTFQ
ncbi:ATP-binding protein [Microvirga sp. 3-52]|uniref:ATP-binding protein n=1 Tax=Microvirga sp. 3-52 TaxID=2792425 RepID=UPI003908AEFB